MTRDYDTASVSETDKQDLTRYIFKYIENFTTKEWKLLDENFW